MDQWGLTTLSLNVSLGKAESAAAACTIDEVCADLRKHLEQAKQNGFDILSYGPSGDYFKDHVHK